MDNEFWNKAWYDFLTYKEWVDPNREMEIADVADMWGNRPKLPWPLIYPRLGA